MNEETKPQETAAEAPEVTETFDTSAAGASETFDTSAAGAPETFDTSAAGASETSDTSAPETKAVPEAEAAPEGKTKRKDKKDAKKLNEQLAAVTAERDALQKKLEEARDAHLRTLAEYDNYRKRTVREKDEIYPNATAAAITKFLPAIDAFERGMQSACSDEKFLKGMGMVQNQMNAALEGLGCIAFGEPGDLFDPNLHNAIMREDAEETIEPTVSEVFQKGYKLGEKIVRFAMVKVKE